MIQLDRHIEILLLNNDCVIVPGLGGFMAHHVCARYYPDTQSFLPPTRQLGFNPQLQINDSVLAQSYIEAYDISYPEALRRIDEEVNELKQRLNNNGRCDLNDIGVLRLNNEGNIEFEPCDAGILTPSLYGLNHLDIVPLELVQKQAANNSVTDTTQQKQDGILPTPQPIPQLANQKSSGTDISDEEDDEYDDNDNDRKYIKIRISTIRHIATAAAVIAVLCLCAIPFGKLDQPQITKSYLDSNVFYNILPECFRIPSKNTAEKKVDFKKQPATEKKTTKKVVTVVKPTSEEKEIQTVGNKTVDTQQSNINDKQNATQQNVDNSKEQHFFSIVLASKVTKANAEDYVLRLKKNGFDKAEMISRANNSTKVIYGHFNSAEEAQSVLRNLRSTAKEFSDGWVMEF